MGPVLQNTRYHFLVVDIGIHYQLRVYLLSADVVYSFVADAGVLTVHMLADKNIAVLANLRCSQIEN